MYNRVRSRTLYKPTRSSWNLSVERTKEDAGSGLCSGEIHSVTYYPTDIVHPLEYSRGIIEDLVTKTSRVKRRRKSSRLVGPRAVKPVHHKQVKLHPLGDVTFVRRTDNSDSLCRDITVATQTCPLTALCASYLTTDAIVDFLDNLDLSLSEFTFSSVDWFSLVDEFDETCKSLVPARFFAGETIAEGSIYFDAIKLILNPQRSILRFISNVRKRGVHRLSLHELDLYYKKLLRKKEFRMTEEGYRLGNDLELTKHGVKEFINGHLSFKFGVLPAIHDLRLALDAHRNVDKRLLYLNRNRGLYVPIRVKRKFPTSDAPGSTPSSTVFDFTSVFREAYLDVCLFGMGRVRTDINEASRWRAYTEYFGLNKVVGTAWELIPFSFVVDWFTNAQERINSLTRIPLGESPFMNLGAIGHSIKKAAKYDFVCIPTPDNSHVSIEPSDPFPVFSYEISDYTRSPGIPDTSGLVDLSSLGLFQGLTGLELLIQKFL